MLSCIGRCERPWAAAFLLVLLAGCGASKTPMNAAVTIESEPSGAAVTIKSRECGVTPLRLTSLEPGKTTVMFTLDRHERTYATWSLVAGENGTKTVTLKPLVGFVTLKSDPPGAEVTLDDEPLGQTPIHRVAVPIGEHTYVVRHENFLPAEKTLEVEANYQYEFTHQLSPLQATLTVMSRPTGATIWIDEQRQADKSPARFKLAPGTYTVAVQRGGYLRADEVVVLGPNDDRKVDLMMLPGEAPEGMVLVPAGPFLMGQNGGAPDEAPQREVHLEAYYIDRQEITNIEYRKAYPLHLYPEGQDHFPVTGISFSQAMDYAAKVGKRLPTEAEWEKAARGTDGREYPWGNVFDKQLCNVEESSVGKPVRSGRYLLGASPYKCLDMAGNVYEWTSSWYEAYPGNELITKDYGQVYRVLRGGSYLTQRFEARCARRHFDRMDAARKDYGFRCVMDLPSDPDGATSP